jgi:outer membrane protein TolC
VQFEQAKKAEELSLNRYSLGLETLLTYLESERRRINAENNLVLVKGDLWTNRVNLFLALGGNWIVEKKIEVENEK